MSDETEWTTTEFTTLTDCRDCPCLNHDYESGTSCGLGYDSDLFWSPTELVTAARNCGLESVKYHAEFKPATIQARRLRTDGR